MSRLIKPSEYAKQSGVSRQAVYAKIKKGLLKSKKVDGQIFIELDSSVNINTKKSEASSVNKEVHNDLLLAKDETIKILKDTIDDLKATNNLIVGTLKGEVDLLKEAFGEMQQLYRTQIEHLQIKEPAKLERNSIVDVKNYIDIKELARVLNLDKTERKKFKKAASKLQENGDFRFTIIEEELYALKSADYNDFLEALK
jgi:hypothetical protein